MANKNYSSMKASQKNSDQSYEGESGPSSQRDTVKSFGMREDVNEMKGTGAPTSKQATYKLPTDQWRG